MRTILATAILALLLAPVGACGGDDGDGGAVDAATPDAIQLADANLLCPEPTSVLPNEWRPINAVAATTVQDQGGGSALLDASAGGPPNAAENPFLYVRFGAAGPEKVDITDTESFLDPSWDIALKRSVIRSNSGDSGLGGVTVAAVPAATLADVTAPPAAGSFREDDWVTDDCVYQGGLIGEPLTAVGTWYDYDVMTNTLDPMELVYVVQRRDGTMFMFDIQSWYDGNQNGGFFDVQWAQLQ